MVPMIAIAVCVWALVVTGVVTVCVMARRGDEPEYAAAARMHALRRLSPGCPEEERWLATRGPLGRRRRPGARRRGARSLP
jgi:hypothetical protein